MAPLDFDGKDSAARLRSLQDLCMVDGQYQAILVIGGADGSQNRGSTSILKYLFTGTSGQGLMGEQVLSEQAEALEDTILLISYSNVSIYYNDDASKYIVPLISSWRNVKEYSLSRSQQQNQQEWEKIKIEAFVNLIKPSKRIGITLSSNDPMEVEKWPLIQAYALDEVQQQGFFTMNHAVINCSKDVEHILSHIDEYSIRQQLYDAEPILRRHWIDFLTNADHADEPRDRMTMSEAEFGDDLISFYDFGIVRHSSRGIDVLPERGARVLFGTHTNKYNEKSDHHTAEEHGIGNLPSVHAFVEGEDPATGLRVGRTYFLSSGKIVKKVIDEDALIQPIDPLIEKYQGTLDTIQDTKYLIDLYLLLLKAFKRSISTYVDIARSTNDASKCEKGALESALSSFKDHGKSIFKKNKYENVNFEMISSHLDLHIDIFNSCGETCSLIHGLNQVYIRLILKDLPSQIVTNCSVGSLIVGDTIVFNSNDLHIVTEQTPYFKSWIHMGKEWDYIKSLDDALVNEYMLDGPLCIGKEIGEACSYATMFFDCHEIPMLDGTLRAYEDGLVLKSASCNPIIVSFRHDVECFHFVTTDYDNLLLLVLDLKKDETKDTAIEKCLPVYPVTSTIAFPLLNDSRLQEYLMSIISTWKDSASKNSVGFHKPEDDAVILTDGSVQRQYTLTPIFYNTCQIFMKKIEYNLTSLLKPKIFPKIKTITSNWASKSQLQTNEPISLSLIIGIPGSDVKQIGHAICNISSASNEWYIVDMDMRLVDEQLRECPSKVIHLKVQDEIKEIHAKGKYPLRPRLMIIVTGYIDPIELVYGLNTLRESKKVKISSIISCINASNLYIPNTKTLLPKLMDQLSHGWVDNVVITRCSEANRELVSHLRYRLSYVNPTAECFFLSSNVFEGGITSLLMIDDFENENKKNFRELMYPFWIQDLTKYVSSWKHSPFSIDTIRFQMNLTIDRMKFLKQIQILTPKAKFHSIEHGEIHPLFPYNKENEGELRGFRLAQARAASKVIETQEKKVQIKTDSKNSMITIHGTCWNVYALIRFEDSPKVWYEYQACENSAYLQDISYPKTLMHDQSSIFLFTGVDLQSMDFKQLINSMSIISQEKTVIRTRASITKKEKDQIQKQHMTDPVPEGYFFDGAHYVDCLGNPLIYHPSIEQFIEEYINELNGTARKENALADEEKHRMELDLKEF